MTILSLADLASLAPGIDQSRAGAILGLITQVQAWCESPLGAGRPLEITQHREILKLPYDRDSIMQLTRLPVLLTPDPLIEQRAGGPGSWESLPATSYSVDEITGEVEIWLTAATGFQLIFDSNYPNRLSAQTIDIRATYSSGWDFSNTTDNTVLLIKNVAAGLAKFLWDANGGVDQYSTSTQSTTGAIASERIDNQYSVTYSTSTSGATATTASLATNNGSGGMQQAIGNLLYPLKRFQPREFSTMVA